MVAIVLWGDAELQGRYLPGPSGTAGHYWVGDVVRLHTGSGEFDYNEQDFLVYAITISEQDQGEWRAVVELQSGYFLGERGSSGSGSGSGGGSSTGGTSSPPSSSSGPTGIHVLDTESGVEVAGVGTLASDWGVAETEPGVAEVFPRPPYLRQIRDVDVTEVEDGQGIAWDAAEERWVPATLVLESEGGMMPYYIGPTEVFTVPLNRQGLYATTIDVDGVLDVEGLLIEVD